MLYRDFPASFPKILLADNQINKAFGTHKIFSIFGYFYLAGVLAMLFRSLVSLGYVSRLKSEGFPMDPYWQKRFTQLINSMSISVPFKLLISTRVKGPLLAGIFKPAILFPDGILTNLPAIQIKTILMHELYHLKRKDYLINTLLLFMEGLLFYNPAVWVISGIIRKEREHCCDERVLQETRNPLNYAKALIHIAEQQEYTRLVPGAAGTRRAHLKSRIDRILNLQTMKTNLRDKAISMALLAGSFIIFLAISSFSAGPSFFSSGSLNREHFSRFQKSEQIEPVADSIPLKAEAKENVEIEKIDWEAIKAEMELNFSEMKIDMEEMKRERDRGDKERDREFYKGN